MLFRSARIAGGADGADGDHVRHRKDRRDLRRVLQYLLHPGIAAFVVIPAGVIHPRLVKRHAAALKRLHAAPAAQREGQPAHRHSEQYQGPAERRIPAVGNY